MRIASCLILIATCTLTATVAADEISDAIRLLKNKHPDAIVSGAQQIQRQGSRAKKATSQLVKLTAHDRADVRRECGKALVSIGSSASKSILKKLKSSKNLDQRLTLATVVSKIGRDMSHQTKALVKLLGDPSPEVRRLLAQALAKMSPASQPALIGALGDKSPEVREAAAISLGILGTAALVPLREALQSKSPFERAGAASALGRIGPKAKSASPALNALRKDEDAAVRAAAVTAIGGIRGNASHFIPELIKMFEDPDAEVRWAAANAVARFGKEAAPALTDALKNASAPYASHALRVIGPKSVDALYEACGSESVPIRAAAVRLLAEVSVRVKDVAARISPLLEDKDATVRCAAAEALAIRGAEFAATELVAAADDTDASVRAAVAHALAHAASSEEIREVLVKARKDTDLRVRIAAESARWALGESSDVLTTARTHLASADAAVRAAACRALRPMGRAASEAIPELILALEEHPSPEVVDALGSITAAHGNGLLGRAARYKKAPGPTKSAIEDALNWLARHQDSKKSGVNDADGRWHSKDFVKHHKEGVMSGPGGALYSGGVTGLAVSLYLAVGRGDDPVAREGLAFLLSHQDSLGYLSDRASQHFMISHAFATIAMCEAWIVTGDPRYRRCALRAVRASESARNPDLGWRYEPRGGENDTNVTSAVLFALAMAERAGIAVDPEAMKGGARFIASMTETEYGQIGYNVKGGSSARPEGLQDTFLPEDSAAMVAAGVWGFALTARHGDPVPNLRGSRKICMDLTPDWRRSRRDMYYWYYATHVFHARQGKEWKKWSGALTKTLLDNQRKDSPEYAGSWDPTGVWGEDGGRVYSTAICALALATPFRMTPDFIPGNPAGVHGKAAQALTKAARGKDPEISARAALWLRRIGD